jgi:hypothetical protein
MAAFRPGRPDGGIPAMWEAIKHAIDSTGRTVRFIVIVVALAAVAWLLTLH